MSEAAPGWREILAPQYLTRFLFLCLGVWLNAADSLVTVTITPSIAQDIGGFRYFAWSVAAFLLASILSGAVSGRLSLKLGLRGALTASAIVYAVGCVMSAAAPDFLIFVAGRLVQGFGAGRSWPSATSPPPPCSRNGCGRGCSGPSPGSGA